MSKTYLSPRDYAIKYNSIKPDYSTLDKIPKKIIAVKTPLEYKRLSTLAKTGQVMTSYPSPLDYQKAYRSHQPPQQPINIIDTPVPHSNTSLLTPVSSIPFRVKEPEINYQNQLAYNPSYNQLTTNEFLDLDNLSFNTRPYASNEPLERVYLATEAINTNSNVSNYRNEYDISMAKGYIHDSNDIDQYPQFEPYHDQEEPTMLNYDFQDYEPDLDSSYYNEENVYYSRSQSPMSFTHIGERNIPSPINYESKMTIRTPRVLQRLRPNATREEKLELGYKLKPKLLKKVRSKYGNNSYMKAKL